MSEQQTFQKITQATIEEHRQIEFYLDQVSVKTAPTSSRCVVWRRRSKG